jgi:hypothetical protein
MRFFRIYVANSLILVYILCMIIEFSVKNFRSFKDLATLSFEAETLKSQPIKLIKGDAGNFLPVVGVFGPNASGKSNLIRALHYMWWSVQNTNFLQQPTPGNAALLPFLLNSETATEPSYFQIVMFDPDRQAEYRYGFTASRSAILSEWLEVTARVEKNRRRMMIFTRDEQKFTVHKSAQAELSALVDRVLPTALGISVFAQFAYGWALRIAMLLSNDRFAITDASVSVPPTDAIQRLEHDTDFRQRIERWMGVIDSNIRQLAARRSAISPEEFAVLPPQLRALMSSQGAPPVRFEVNTIHQVHDVQGQTVTFNLNDHESQGTRRFFELLLVALPILENGGVLIVDELGASLHPLIVQAMVGLFQDESTNIKGAQLIFTSHETYLMQGDSALRRDEIWFTEKNTQEETDLRSLAEFKTRGDFEIAKNYMAGRFGAVPIVKLPKDV